MPRFLTWSEADPFSQKDTFSNRKRYCLTDNNYSNYSRSGRYFWGENGYGSAMFQKRSCDLILIPCGKLEVAKR